MPARSVCEPVGHKQTVVGPRPTVSPSGTPAKGNLELGVSDEVIRRPSHVTCEVVTIGDQVPDMVELSELAHEVAIESERRFKVDWLI